MDFLAKWRLTMSKQWFVGPFFWPLHFLRQSYTFTRWFLFLLWISFVVLTSFLCGSRLCQTLKAPFVWRILTGRLLLLIMSELHHQNKVLLSPSSHNNVNDLMKHLVKTILQIKCFWQVNFIIYQVAFRSHTISRLQLKVWMLELEFRESVAGQEVYNSQMSFLHFRGLHLEDYDSKENL